MEKIESLHKHRMKKMKELIDKSVEDSDIEFSEVTDELLEYMVNKGDITLKDAIKTLWFLAESLDHIETEILRLKLLILEGARNPEPIDNEIYYGSFDGSATPNPGEMTIGGVIKNMAGDRIRSYTKPMGEGTNNQAEYLSLINLLKEAKDAGIKKLIVTGDSLLVVNQVNGKWKTRDPRLQKLRREIFELLRDFEGWTLSHVPREENKEADKLT